MKEQVNWKTIAAGAITILIGVALICLDIFKLETETKVWLNVGCSVFASGLVVLLTAIFFERKKVNPLDDWKISKIYKTRLEKNEESDPKLEKISHCVDGVAFGLKTFRTGQTKRVEDCLRRGVNFRLLTMAPDSPHVAEREAEEKESAGQIKNTINQLINWANALNKKDYRGKIIVKGYSCMTLDFYWRLDNDMYVGPYMYGVDSKQTITYKFESGGKAFQLYSEYFENLWNDNSLTRPLTEITEFTVKKRRKKT